MYFLYDNDFSKFVPLYKNFNFLILYLVSFEQYCPSANWSYMTYKLQFPFAAVGEKPYSKSIAQNNQIEICIRFEVSR